MYFRANIWLLNLILIFNLNHFGIAQKDPHFRQGRSTIVHLFEWKWNDIADECERFLQYKGYAGVQVSPPNENLVIGNRPWWERYQPVSYKLVTRSGNADEFLNMTKRCNAVGVRIYVDAVINHMSAGSGIGTAGSIANYNHKVFPAVPYTQNDFHNSCSIDNYQDASNVRNCQLVGLLDLNQGLTHVRQKVIDYMNSLIDLGVAGFRVDAAKHIWPADLEQIYNGLKYLSKKHGFSAGAKPFIYQEVIDLGGEAVKESQYTKFGTVLEFKYGNSLGRVFQGNDKLTYLNNWGIGWGLTDGLNAVAFIDNHDTQRTGGPNILTYKKAKQYKMAIAFMLAHPYGTTRIISSYSFDNNDQGPPQDSNGNLISPKINTDDTCSNGYICEHRWRQIYNMVGFRNTVDGTGINNWWSNGDQQIAFCRGNKGFVVFTNWGDIINKRFQTLLSRGSYCDVISGNAVNGVCTGKTIKVERDGWVTINLGGLEEDGVIAIHANSRVD